MKNLVVLFIGALLLISSQLSGEEKSSQNNTVKGQLNIVTSPDLYNLVGNWVEGCTALYPDLEIRVNAIDEAGKDALSKADIGIFMRSRAGMAGDEKSWKMSAGREIIVPFGNSGNPYFDEITKKGISAEGFTRILRGDHSGTWAAVVGEGAGHPVHIFISGDPSVTGALKQFLGVEDLPAGIIFKGSHEEMVAAVQADPYAIAFGRLADITVPDGTGLADRISLLPVDKNGNGTLDYMEQIYEDTEAFTRGVWIGKYPRELAPEIYIVSNTRPADETGIAFVKWVLTGGQAALAGNGFNELVYSEKQSRLAKINEITIIPPMEPVRSFPAMVLIVLGGLIVLSIIISLVILYRRRNAAVYTAERVTGPQLFREDSLDAPEGLYYDRTHTWAFMEKDGRVRIGIDDFLQHVTGPLTRVEMKNPGDRIRKGEIVMSLIQKGKKLNIYSPVSGTILEKNRALSTGASILGSSPYSDGWIYMIKPLNWTGEIQLLEMADKYRIWLKGEFTRLKDFLSASIKISRTEYEHAVLQDGGSVREHVLEELGPEIWEDFQAEFIDVNK